MLKKVGSLKVIDDVSRDCRNELQYCPQEISAWIMNHE